MAIRLDSTTESYTRTANLPTSTSWTVAGWFTRRGTGGSANIICGLFASGASAYQYIADAGTNVVVASHSASANIIASPSVNTPYFFALTCSGTGSGNLIGYYGLRNATSLTSASLSGVSFTPATFSLSDSSFGAFCNGDIGPLYVWNAVLTADQLLAQSKVIRLLWGTSINVYLPMMRSTASDNAIDFSGNGRNMTVNGSPTVIDNPPISYGASGILFPYAAAGGTTYDQDAGGTLTSSGALALLTQKYFTGTLTGAGTETRQTNKLTTGIVTSAGMQTRETSKVLSGSLTPNGLLASVRTFLKELSGTLSASGALVRQTGKVISGSISSLSGEAVRVIGKVISGELTASGALEQVRTFLLSISGTLTSSGAITKAISKVVSGTLSTSGQANKNTTKSPAGTFSTSGAVTKEAQKQPSGVLSSAGAIVRSIQKSVSGTLSTSGTVSRSISKVLSAILSFIGSLLTDSAEEITVGNGNPVLADRRPTIRAAARPVIESDKRKTIKV